MPFFTAQAMPMPMIFFLDLSRAISVQSAISTSQPQCHLQCILRGTGAESESPDDKDHGL